jgi:HEAT repeat protein
MKRTFALIFLFLLAGLSVDICHAEETEEARLIHELAKPKPRQSSWASPDAKMQALARLKQIGTHRCIKTVAEYLTDKELSLSARYVLESMPDSAAGRALIDALPKSTGAIQVGIINSLAARGEKNAVKPLGKLLTGLDTNAAMASAEALGHIGGSKAIDLLQQAAANASSPVHGAAVDGLLTCANQLLDSGNPKDALKIFEKLYASEKTDSVRTAAFRGLLMASGPDGISRLKDGILNGDGPTQSAALLAAAHWPKDAALTKALADVLHKSSVPVQLAIVQCFVQRGDFNAMDAVARMADSPESGVSVAAISALGTLGDDSVVALLAEQAASGNGAKRNAARESLLLLNRGAVAEQMMASLKTASPSAKAELMRALAGREDKTAVPAVLDVAKNGNDIERAAAFQALGQLAGGAEIPRLVQLITQTRNDDVRSGAADALNSIFLRAQIPGAQLDVNSFVSAVESGSAETRLALLPVCSEVTQLPVRKALLAAAADPNANIRDAGIHALCDTKDAELLPDLVKLAQDTNQAGTQLLAVRGCVRLTTQEENIKLPNSVKLDAFTAILATPLNVQEKQLVLSGLSAVADLKSLEIAQRMLDDASVHAEVEKAVIQIASDVSKPHPVKARAALTKIAQETTDDQTRQAAEAALKKIKSK